MPLLGEYQEDEEIKALKKTIESGKASKALLEKKWYKMGCYITFPTGPTKAVYSQTDSGGSIETNTRWHGTYGCWQDLWTHMQEIFLAGVVQRSHKLY